MMRNNRGFTLVELMIVITIIAILAAIALPNLLRSRLLANETSAIGRMRTLSAGQVTYHGANNSYGTFDELLSKDPPWVDGTWGDGTNWSGYIFTMPTVEVNSYEAHAQPVDDGLSGTRYFFVDASGVVRQETGEPAGPDSPPVPL